MTKEEQEREDLKFLEQVDAVLRDPRLTIRQQAREVERLVKESKQKKEK